MKIRIAAVLGVALLSGAPPASAGGAFAPAARPRQEGTPQTSGLSRPAQGTAAAVALADQTVLAWLQQSGDGAQVLARSGDGPARRLGPAGRGSDGPPAAIVSADGSVLVVASRADATGETLWSQRWANGAWDAALAGPSGMARNRHPALAAVRGSAQVWVAWLGEQAGNRTSRTLLASRWDGRGWSAAEPLPRSPGALMAPVIAIDADGNPAVAWAGGDGAGAEIWLSRRIGGRWSAPLALTDNGVPDITPSLATAPEGLLAAWVTYTDRGYLPRARFAAADRWGPVVTLDDAPGGRPLAASIDGAPAVLWRRLDDSPAGGTITARRRLPSGWSAPVALSTASGSPFSFVAAGDGRVLLAWTRPDGVLDRLEGRGGAGSDAWRTLSEAAAARRRGAPGAASVPPPAADAAADADTGGIPTLYSAFGDSITNGVIYDPDRRAGEGYRGPLQELLRGFFGVGTVINDGVDGEGTADGVGRIDNVVRNEDPDVVLIMEGTNDVFADIDEGVIAFNLQQMVERARAEKPSILAFLAQIPPRYDPSFGFEGSFNASADILNAMLVPIAAALDVPLVDENTPLKGDPDLWSNPLHPSGAGYQVMGETWYASVKPVVLDATNRGDIDASGRTDGFDLVRLALAFGSVAGEERYDPVADINGDGIVDGFDLNILAEFFGQSHTGS